MFRKARAQGLVEEQAVDRLCPRGVVVRVEQERGVTGHLR
jgi:hypothetical protein